MIFLVDLPLIRLEVSPDINLRSILVKYRAEGKVIMLQAYNI